MMLRQHEKLGFGRKGNGALEKRGDQLRAYASEHSKGLIAGCVALAALGLGVWVIRRVKNQH